MKSEVDPLPLMRLAKSKALPRFASRKRPMAFHLWSEGEPLEAGPFAIRQPLASSPSSSPDVIVTPLLGFDRSGNRIGQGGGHYDRYFAHVPQALRIGLAWSIQELSAITTESWDIPLDAVHTEREWIVPDGSRLKI